MLLRRASEDGENDPPSIELRDERSVRCRSSDRRGVPVEPAPGDGQPRVEVGLRSEGVRGCTVDALEVCRKGSGLWGGGAESSSTDEGGATDEASATCELMLSRIRWFFSKMLVVR